MELRRCSHLHFINAIHGDLVTKVGNVDSRGRPGLVFKKLKDIYNVKPKPELETGYGVADDETGGPCLGRAERKTSEIERKTSKVSHIRNGDEKHSDSDDLSFGEITLRQLKKSCKSSKRKTSDLGCLTPKQELTDSLAEEDKKDLNTPLSFWKSKFSKKARSKKKCDGRIFSSTATHNLSIKTEQIMVAEAYQQSGSKICAPVTVKVEALELDCLESQIMSSGDDDSSICTSASDSDSTKFLLTADTVSYAEAQSTAGQRERCVLNEVSYCHLDSVGPTPFLPPYRFETKELNAPKKTSQSSSVSPPSEIFNEADIGPSPYSQSFQQIVFSADENMPENMRTLSLEGPAKGCDVNAVSYSHLEDVDPTPLLPLLGGETVEFSAPKKVNQNSSFPPRGKAYTENSSSTQSFPQIVLSIDDKSSDMCCISKNSSKMQKISGNSGYQVSDMVINNNCLSTPEISHASQLCISEDETQKISGQCNVSQSCSNPQEVSSSDLGHQVSDVMTADSPFFAEIGHGGELSRIEDNISKCLDMQDNLQSCFNLQEFSGGHSTCQVSDMVIDENLCCTAITCDSKLCLSDDDIKKILSQNLEYGGMSNSFSNSSSSGSCYLRSSTPDKDYVYLDNDSLVIEDKQPLISNIAETGRKFSKRNNHLAVKVDSSCRKKKHSLISVTADAERSLSCGVDDELLISETNNYHNVERWQTPERLPSTRKAISPTSQEELFFAMNSVDLFDNIDQYKCKSKLFFEKQVEDKVLQPGLDNEGFESSTKIEGPGQIKRIKVTSGPKRILKKSKHKKAGSPPKEGSPPKGSSESPHLFRSLPHLSTGCTSIENCSESAIAFSKRQMQDIESLAAKLMTELKSMKDIVEEKVLYEAYHNTSLRNDADEVRLAIKSARKAEETTKKWLSIMTRDCNRFCKIMSQKSTTEEGTATTGNVIQKEKKKITFADEAGGKLCHVNFYEKCMEDIEINSENQNLQTKEG